MPDAQIPYLIRTRDRAGRPDFEVVAAILKRDDVIANVPRLLKAVAKAVSQAPSGAFRGATYF